MKRGLKVIKWFFAVMPFIVASCMMRDSEDFPDFNEQLQKDVAAIDDYLAAHNVQNVIEDNSGIRYVIHRDSVNTNKATIDSCVTVHYEGKLMLTGQEFDDGTRVSFPVSSLINGWKIGIPLLDEGDSATFYIPSGWGYGFRGSQDIPANANLIFHIGLVHVGSTFRSSDRSCH